MAYLRKDSVMEALQEDMRAPPSCAMTMREAVTSLDFVMNQL